MRSYCPPLDSPLPPRYSTRFVFGTIKQAPQERALFVAKARLNLRKVETQATLSIMLSLSSVFFLLGLGVLVVRHLDWETKSIFYVSGTLRIMAMAFCGFLSMTLSVFGFGFGISSAGQRRNQKSHLSWTGFFVGAFVMCMTLVMLATFYLWKEPVMTG